MENFFKDRRIAVTGARGFIGSRLTEALLRQGAEVTSFDRQPVQTGSHKERTRFIEGEVKDFDALWEAFQDQEIVFHFAAVLGVEAIMDRPLDVLEVNLQGTVNALRAAVASGVRRFIFSSSSEVYGEPVRVPISEDDPTAPVSTYGVSKLAAEEYCKGFQHDHGLEVTILRYFNVYGPGQAERFVMPIFISRVLQNQPPIIYGNGEQVRSYTYVDDAINGTLLACASEAAAGEIFNIGRDGGTRIKDLASYIIQLSGRDLTPQYRFWGDGIRTSEREIQNRLADISKARLVLGYEPHVGMEEGVKAYMAWYESSLKGDG